MPSMLTMLILRVAQALVAVLVLGLAGDAVNSFKDLFPELQYLLFCGAFAILSVGYLILSLFMTNFAHIVITLVLDALNTIFFFSGFIAVAAVVDTGNCEDLEGLDFGLLNQFVTPCQCAQASSGIGALAWLLWLATLILVAREAYLNRATTPAPQLAAANKESSSDAGAVEAGVSETGLKETTNEEEPQPVERPQMSDPDI